mmetsp:Transcript_37649/g.86940  ORF Transcript_37649/g.86940 Transcript_37649/m.86940 type:complete len:94 (-) Transcript_37649:175-456(-)
MGACCHKNARLMDSTAEKDWPIPVHHSAEEVVPGLLQSKNRHVKIVLQDTGSLPSTDRNKKRIPTGFVRKSDVHQDEELDEISDELEPDTGSS